MTRTRLGVLVFATLMGGAVLVAWRLSGAMAPPVPWAHLGTEDVHSLAFVPGATDRVLFGHHEGILESQDGGRTWAPLSIDADAMELRPAADGSIVIAGHDVLVGSSDGGQTWAPIGSDLPNIDIHAFARDPMDPATMWAYLAGGGVYETTDGGIHWTKVYEGHIPFMTAIRGAAGVELLGIEPFSGFARSIDRGRTWHAISEPEAYPTYAMAATPDGQIVVLGTSDGILRSDDGGTTWSAVRFPDLPLAIAVSPDGEAVAVVTRSTDFYRSDDGGRTWQGP